MLVVAHRGNLQQGFENSLAAFDAAVASGCHRIELDVQVALDGTVYVVHDRNLKRLTGYKRSINRLGQKEIDDLRLPNGQPIPKLSEVLERYLPQIELNIEIKDPRKKAIAQIIKLVNQHPQKDKIIISSFFPCGPPSTR